MPKNRENFKVDADLSKREQKLALVLLGVIVALGGTLAFFLVPNRSAFLKPDKPTQPAKTSSAHPKEIALTPEELVEFDSKIIELDPESKFITGVSQFNDSEVVTITVTTLFSRATQIEQGEVAISMRDALAKTCDCRPALIFKTQGGQKLVRIGRGQPEFFNK